MKVEIDEKIVTSFLGLWVKTYNYLIDNCSQYKKTKGRKKCVIKRKLKFHSYKICSKATKFEIKIKH